MSSRIKPGPWMLLVPTAFFVGASVHFLFPGLARRAVDTGLPPVATAPDAPVTSFVGEVELPGGTLSVRLAPLHGEPARQAYDAGVLAERLGLAAGEPWRLVLEGELPALDAETLTIEDDRGGLLAALEALVAVADDARPDPLAALFARRSTSADGSSTSWLLWGTPPGEVPELVWITEDETLRTALVPEDVTCGSIPRYVARFEAAADEDDGGPR